MKHSLEFVMPVENGLHADTCKTLIDKFEEKIADTIVRDEDGYKFKELNLVQTEGFGKECDVLQATSNYLLSFYKRELDVKYFPGSFVLEEFRMKKYEPNDSDQFDWHVDVGDYDSAKRFMVIFFYLNTVEEGGQTMFDWSQDNDNAVVVEPKGGTAVMFPPFWTHPHKGAKPISGPKYIVSTYAHYL